MIKLFQRPTDYLLGKEMIMVNNDLEFKIVTNHFKQDVNDDANKELINLLQELDLKNKNKIINIIKTIIELSK